MGNSDALERYVLDHLGRWTVRSHVVDKALLTLYPSPDPPSANVTLDDTMNLGIIAGFPKVSDAMSATSGPYCYIYE